MLGSMSVPLSTRVTHTAHARQVLGPEPVLAVELTVDDAAAINPIGVPTLSNCTTPRATMPVPVEP